MAELLKDMYNYESLHEIAKRIQSVYHPFRVDEFLKSTMDQSWNDLELKARVRKISSNLGRYLPADYGDALAILDQVVSTCSSGFFGILFPDFVEVYGQDEKNWNLSIKALERYTPYSSSEFAVRPFIINQEERMMAQMYAWSKHESEHVRRLASEGCRPQLPWGQVLDSFKKDPTPIIPILEQLKNDSSAYVRKSVANNLNDISKTHPDLVLGIARKWYGMTDHTDWIVKHGCRTLLKKADSEAMAFFEFDDTASVKLLEFVLDKTSISIGDSIAFSFSVLAEKEVKARLEYGIDYVKSNGRRSRKRFKISEVTLKENEERSYEKKHSFKDLSTRKHYPGIHSIAIIVNGAERDKLDFSLEK